MQRSRKSGSLLGLAAFAVITAAASFSTARADETPAGTVPAAQADNTFAGDVPTRFWLDLGWSNNEIYTNASLQGPNGIGVTVDFEDVFDIPGSKQTARGFGTVRISKARRYIDFGYVDINRSGSRILDEDLTWGDSTISANSTVAATFNTGFIYTAFRYDFLHLEPVHISGSAGLTWINLSTSLSAEGSIVLPDGSPSGTYYKKVSTGAPVPMVGLSIDWAIHRRLVVRMYSRFFRLNTGSDFNGALNEAGIRLNWYFVKYFGLGVGYDRTDLNLKELSVGNGDVVKANYSFSGASLFICLAF